MMEGYRSKSIRDGGMMQIESYNGGGGEIGIQGGPTNMHDLRSYNTSHASSVHQSNMGKIVKMKKDQKNNNTGSTSKSWSFNDPELQRKKRVAAYKVYTVEGEMKGSFKKSFRWIKDTCSQVVHGWSKDVGGWLVKYMRQGSKIHHLRHLDNEDHFV